MGTSEAIATVLDVRELPPRERHARIFASFAQLAPGQALLLVHDHDPKPLYYQFTFEHPGEVAKATAGA
ncbi:MAG TPA: DUF2249 domain-containing protein [Chloroflexota bacterium]|jgi:uncharacterized protein (DUF2249 family)